MVSFDILGKINTRMLRHLAKYQYLCTHETVYEKTIPTHIVGQRDYSIVGMRLLAVHPLRHHLVSTDHFYFFLGGRGVRQYCIRSPAAHPPLHAHGQEVGGIHRALRARRIAHQQSDVQPYLQLGNTPGELSPGWQPE